MIMKHERNEDKNDFLLFLLPEIFTVIAGSTAVYAMGIFGKQLSVENALRNAVMTAMGLAVAGFFLRREQLDSQLDYDNDEHLMRFWIAVWSCLLLSLACTFLPVGGWPFLPVFVVLSLFSNLPVGILFSSVFLMIASFEGQTQGIFFLYFISGIFAACLFQHLEQEFAIGIPLFLSLFCLFLCETANIVLLTNEHLSLEQFLVPAANLVVSGILLLGILKFFSGAVVFRDRVRYLDLNDTENQILAKYRQTDRMQSHRQYHKKGWELMNLQGESFPKGAKEILEEYKEDQKYRRKETVVLYCSDAVVSAILLLSQKEPDKKPDYDQVIDKIFERIRVKGFVNECDLSLRDWNRMQKIFKEEKLYYDFLR